MLRAAAAALLLLPAAALAATPRTGYTSCRARGPRQAAPAPAAAALVAPSAEPELDAEREELVQAIQRFEEEGKGYRAELQREIEQTYKARRLAFTDHFERALEEVETLERGERDDAIARFEVFF